jgi:hypothetical protein
LYRCFLLILPALGLSVNNLAQQDLELFEELINYKAPPLSPQRSFK